MCSRGARKAHKAEHAWALPRTGQTGSARKSKATKRRSAQSEAARRI